MNSPITRRVLDSLSRAGSQLEARRELRWERYLFDREVAHQDALTRVFLRIRNRHGQLVRLQPNAAQKLYARRRAQRNIILKARQVGMTTYIAARFFVATITRPGTVTLQVAHSLESAQQIFCIVHRFMHSLHPHWRDALGVSRSNVREISLGGLDSRYIVDTAGNRNVGRGLTVHNLHASEVARWPYEPQETMAALLAAVAPGGAVDIESTPCGLGNYFHQEWLRASAREGFTPHFFPWWIEAAYRLPLNRGETLAPLSPEELLLMERHQLDLEQVKFRRYLRASFGDLAPQEYAESDADCFLVSGRPVFDVALIESRLREIDDPLRITSNGAEQMWLMPQAKRRYIVGADVAEGGESGDFSAAVVIDAGTGLQCAELLARWPISRFAEELAELGHRYDQALIAVERNNHGHAVLHALEHQLHYPRIYRHTASPLTGGTSAGWPMNAQTKPQAINCLAKMLRDAPQVFQSRRLLEQCRAYSYREGKTGAPAGMHDDLVMAMAIALAVRAQAGSIQLLGLPL